ncbi:TPA: hypothetical protein ACTW12_005963, partial [Raoultella planticola]
MSTDLHSHLSAVAPVVTAAFAWGLHGKTHLCSDGQPGLPRHYRYPIDVSYNLYYIYINTNCIHADSEIKPMPDLKEILKNSLFNQIDDSVSAPISIRLPTILNNELDELSLSFDRSKSSLISEFIKAGVVTANELLKEHSLVSAEMKEQLVDQREDSAASFLDRKAFMLNTNYNNDVETHFDMVK